MTTITDIGGTTATKATTLSQQTMGTGDFLRLLTEQLKQQDPFKPTDNAQMVTQMAQMSQTSATAEMSQTLKTITQQLADQTALLKSIAAQRSSEPGNTETPAS